MTEFKTLRRALAVLIGFTVVACCVLSVLIVKVQNDIAHRETATVIANQKLIYEEIKAIRERSP